MAASISRGRPGLWSELGPLPGLSVSDCTLLAPLGQDMLRGADAHVEQMGSVPSVSCAPGEESPELGGNIHILTPPGPTTDSFLSRVTSLPSAFSSSPQQWCQEARGLPALTLWPCAGDSSSPHCPTPWAGGWV